MHAAGESDAVYRVVDARGPEDLTVEARVAIMMRMTTNLLQKGWYFTLLK